jgi:glutathione S-transferase
MKLYGHPMSPRVRRVAIAASELGLPLELVELKIAEGENRSAAYLAKNPMGKIPTFEDDDGWVLWESLAMLVYLAEKHPERGLFPTDVRGRANANRWMFWSCAHLEPAVFSLVVQRVIGPMRGQTPDEAVVGAATRDLARYLPVLESQASRGQWMLGDSFSMVDIALGTNFDALLHPALGFDVSAYPSAGAWHRRLVERPSWWGTSKPRP